MSGPRQQKHEANGSHCIWCGSARLPYIVCEDCGQSQGASLEKKIDDLKRKLKELEGELTTAYMTGYHKRDDEVASLRAALEEKPLAKMWREKAAKLRKEVERVRAGTGWWAHYARQADKLEQCADDLDSQRDRDRELLRRIAKVLPSDSNIVTEIRKHLEGDSDEQV